MGEPGLKFSCPTFPGWRRTFPTTTPRGAGGRSSQGQGSLTRRHGGQDITRCAQTSPGHRTSRKGHAGSFLLLRRTTLCRSPWRPSPLGSAHVKIWTRLPVTHQDTSTLSIHVWQRNWVCRRETAKVGNHLRAGSTASTSTINPPRLAGGMWALISWTNTSSEKSITLRSFKLIKQMH